MLLSLEDTKLQFLFKAQNKKSSNNRLCLNIVPGPMDDDIWHKTQFWAD
jgi:hypothetical protein